MKFINLELKCVFKAVVGIFVLLAYDSMVPLHADTIVPLCQKSPIEGFWVNTQTNLQKQDVWRFEITSTCHGTKTQLQIRVEVECGRFPCRWRRSILTPLDMENWVSLVQTFSADRQINLKKSGTLLEGRFHFDFHSKGRLDARQNGLFSRQF